MRTMRTTGSSRKSRSRTLTALVQSVLGIIVALAVPACTAVTPSETVIPAAAVQAPAGTGQGLVVGTGEGQVRGKYADGAREFLGIPYAAPPTGALRWRPPQPAARWSGVRDATAPGSSCAQNASALAGTATTVTNEDCLNLNLYTPQSPARRPLPVMVWIYGGAFSGGSASAYDGAVLAAKGNVIVVTINYRLSAFGFLDLPSLGAGNGDFGLLDQQAALRWVQRNIRAFDGNPHEVTLFGESAGAASVCDNMASPSAAGLFAGAIAESGCLLPVATAQQVKQESAALAAKLGCTDATTAAACLRAKPASSILQAEGTIPVTTTTAAPVWAPVTGTPVLPLPAPAAFASGRYLHVPLIQGTNHDEGRLFVEALFDASGHPLTATLYPLVIEAAFGAAGPTVLARYPLSSYASPDLAYAQILTDSQFSCPALEADNLTAHSGVHAYEFSDPDPPVAPLPVQLGATHGAEIQYVFQRVPALDTVPLFTPAQLALSN